MHLEFTRHPLRRPSKWLALCAALSVSISGCTGLRDYVHNGLKVGPNYHKPPALVAEHWIDAADKRVKSEPSDLSTWWAVMNDPVLNQLMIDAYQQNLTLREAGYRVLESRAQLGIAIGEFFPQQQNATGSYRRIGSGTSFFDQWNVGFNLAWELDFWGRFRRAIQASEDTLDASVFNYDEVLVTLLGDIASNYVQYRTDQERIRLLEITIKLQQDVVNFLDERLKFGKLTDLDKAQAVSQLKQSQAAVSLLKIDQRFAQNRLCTLLGIPPVDLDAVLNSPPNQPIPTVPDYLVVGMPADLLRQRPDVRRAERLAAAQAELIGIAEAALYPAFSISGTLGWQAAKFSDLFSPQALSANVGPSFQWNLLNYGRLLNNIRFQDATFQELVATYQQTVLSADEEVENGIVTFLQSQDRARLLKESVDASNVALSVILAQYNAGATGVDFNQYAVILQNLINQQDLWAQARGQIDQGLIQVYRALGGGWQIRLHPNPEELRGLPPVMAEPPKAPEQVPPPAPEALPMPMPVPNPAATLLVPQTVLPASFAAPLTQTPPQAMQSTVPGILPNSQTATPISADSGAPNGFAAPAGLMPGIDCPVTLLPAPAASGGAPAK